MSFYQLWICELDVEFGSIKHTDLYQLCIYTCTSRLFEQCIWFSPIKDIFLHPGFSNIWYDFLQLKTILCSQAFWTFDMIFFNQRHFVHPGILNIWYDFLQSETFLCIQAALAFYMIFFNQAALAGPLAASKLNLQDEDILLTADVSWYIIIHHLHLHRCYFHLYCAPFSFILSTIHIYMYIIHHFHFYYTLLPFPLSTIYILIDGCNVVFIDATFQATAFLSKPHILNVFRSGHKSWMFITEAVSLIQMKKWFM